MGGKSVSGVSGCQKGYLSSLLGRGSVFYLLCGSWNASVGGV
jgi:hypothetical protein